MNASWAKLCRRPRHPDLVTYREFRARLAKAALTDVALSLASHAKTVMVVLGAAAPALVAFLALPSFYAPLLSREMAFIAIAGQAVLTLMPYLLLKRAVLPAATAAWTQRLPLTRRQSWEGNLAASGVMAKWIGVLYTASAAIWLFQYPKWLQPIWGWGIASLLGSQMFAWLAGAWAMGVTRTPAPERARQVTDWAPSPRWNSWRIFLPMLVLPLLRKQGRGATIKVAAITSLMLGWTPVWANHGAAALDRAVGTSFVFTLLLVAATAVLDGALKARLQAIAAAVSGWPVQFEVSTRIARLAALTPMALGLSMLLATAGRAAATAGHQVLIYILSATAMLSALVWLTRPATTARGAWSAAAVAVLTALGSSLWG